MSCRSGLREFPTVVPVKWTEVQADVNVESSRNIAWLQMTAYCPLPHREGWAVAGLLAVALDAHASLPAVWQLSEESWAYPKILPGKLRHGTVWVTSCQPSVLHV